MNNTNHWIVGVAYAVPATILAYAIARFIIEKCKKVDFDVKNFVVKTEC